MSDQDMLLTMLARCLVRQARDYQDRELSSDPDHQTMTHADLVQWVLDGWYDNLKDDLAEAILNVKPTEL